MRNLALVYILLFAGIACKPPSNFDGSSLSEAEPSSQLLDHYVVCNFDRPATPDLFKGRLATDAEDYANPPQIRLASAELVAVGTSFGFEIGATDGTLQLLRSHHTVNGKRSAQFPSAKDPAARAVGELSGDSASIEIFSRLGVSLGELKIQDMKSGKGTFVSDDDKRLTMHCLYGADVQF